MSRIIEKIDAKCSDDNTTIYDCAKVSDLNNCRNTITKSINNLSVRAKESTATNLLRSDIYDKSKVLILSTPQMSREHHLVEYGPNIAVSGYKLGTF